MPITYYTEKEYAIVKAEAFRLELQVKALDSLRPHWAKGYTTDSAAAQLATAALTQLWDILKTDNQTTAVLKLGMMIDRLSKTN